MQPSLSQKTALIAHLETFLQPERSRRIEEVLALRTRHISVLFEDLYQPQNASAVLRTCDCLGIQDAHVIENVNHFETRSDIAMGAQKWLTMHLYRQEGGSNTRNAIRTIKNLGYKLAATCPHREDYTLETLPIDQPLMLCFGTEKQGLSDTLLENADYHVRIPMFGFTESYNISVAAALSLYALVIRMRNSSVNWALTEAEKIELHYQWICQAVRLSDPLIEEWLKKNPIL